MNLLNFTTQSNLVSGAGRKVLIHQSPYASNWIPAKSDGADEMVGVGFFDRGQWPCAWIHHPAAFSRPAILLFRLKFKVASCRMVRVHVTADEGYELAVDGTRIGRGPERGEISHWFFDTYDIPLTAGEHLIMAKVQALGVAAPRAQVSLCPGLLLSPEARDDVVLLGTGVAAWECRTLPGYSFIPPFPHDRFSIGYNTIFDAGKMDAQVEAGAGLGWLRAEAGRPGLDPEMSNRQPASHLLYPAMMPAMLQVRRCDGDIRSVESLPPGSDPAALPWTENSTRETDEKAWTAVFQGHGSVVVPSGQTLRVLIDLDDYLCARTVLSLGTCRGASVSVKWAEALFNDMDYTDKGHRDQIGGKYFYGVGDTYLSSSSRPVMMESIFWRAGRYVEIVVHTEEEPLCVLGLSLIETRYPSDLHFDFESNNPSFADWIPLALRSLESSAHDSLIDGPYYEQMMWVGDGVQTALAHYCTELDDRLIKKSILLFDKSRMNDGLPRARWPARDSMLIVPYVFHWINLVHDLAFWRDEEAFVRRCMPGIRAACDALGGFRNAEGLIQIRRGWNFVDWVPGWSNGIPPGGDGGVSAIINWHCVYVLTLVQRLEGAHGEPELAARAGRMAKELAASSIRTFWNREIGLFADDPTHETFSEHGQCFAILSGLLPGEILDQIALAEDRPLTRCTISFLHFLFDALVVLRRPDLILERLKEWTGYPALGLKTLPEAPEPTRSDCHAWGAHPLYHLMASILGIRPNGPGFRRVQISPQLGGLRHARGSLPHPLGRIEVSYEQDEGELSAVIMLPEGLAGDVTVGGQSRSLRPGENRLTFRVDWEPPARRFQSAI